MQTVARSYVMYVRICVASVAYVSGLCVYVVCGEVLFFIFSLINITGTLNAELMLLIDNGFVWCGVCVCVCVCVFCNVHSEIVNMT